jgi:hypothetical protein
MRARGLPLEGEGVVNHFWGPRKYWGKTEVCEVAASQNRPKEVTQMVTDRKKDSAKTPVRQGPQDVTSEPNKINASTPYDFNGKNLTPYGGLRR